MQRANSVKGLIGALECLLHFLRRLDATLRRGNSPATSLAAAAVLIVVRYATEIRAAQVYYRYNYYKSVGALTPVGEGGMRHHDRKEWGAATICARKFGREGLESDPYPIRNTSSWRSQRNLAHTLQFAKSHAKVISLY